VPGTEVGRQVLKTLLFRVAHRVVGEEDETAGTEERAHGLIQVDPSVHRAAPDQADPRWAQLDGPQRSGRP
jgi:hypothetical protein